MKKLIVLGIMFLGVVAMAEKLNTDGKDHLKEILGEWGSNRIRFYQKNGELWYLDLDNYGYDDDTIPEKITMLNNYTYMIHSSYSEKTLKTNPELRGKKLCFAYDTKYKKIAFLKKCGNDEIQELVPRKYNDGKLRG